MLKKTGIFTTIKIIKGKPLFLEKHIQRLSQKSPAKIKNQKILKILEKFVEKNKTHDAALRVDIFEDGKIKVGQRQLPKTGGIVSATTVLPSSLLPRIKKIDRRIYEKAHKQAQKEVTDVAIFARKGFLLESERSNLVLRDSRGNLVTPYLAKEGLKGIARAILLEKKVVKEAKLSINTPGPLILINSLRVEGVGILDGRKLKDPKALLKKIAKILYENSDN